MSDSGSVPVVDASDSVESAARAALNEIALRAQIGALRSRSHAADGVVELRFSASVSGHPGWEWAVTVAVIDGDAPTVLELGLLPGDGALLAPAWVPWADRLEELRAQGIADGEAGVDGDSGEHSDDDFDTSEDVDDLDELFDGVDLGEDEPGVPEAQLDVEPSASSDEREPVVPVLGDAEESPGADSSDDADAEPRPARRSIFRRRRKRPARE